ncbi:hypothetical protein ES708_15540 [subsurface metagenome]
MKVLMKNIIEHPIPSSILRTILLSNFNPMVFTYSFRDCFPSGRSKERGTINNQNNAITPKETKKSINSNAIKGIISTKTSTIKIKGNSISIGKNKNPPYNNNRNPVPKIGYFLKLSLILIIFFFPRTFGNMLLNEINKIPKENKPAIKVTKNIISAP